MCFCDEIKCASLQVSQRVRCRGAVGVQRRGARRGRLPADCQRVSCAKEQSGDDREVGAAGDGVGNAPDDNESSKCADDWTEWACTEQRGNYSMDDT